MDCVLSGWPGAFQMLNRGFRHGEIPAGIGNEGLGDAKKDALRIRQNQRNAMEGIRYLQVAREGLDRVLVWVVRAVALADHWGSPALERESRPGLEAEFQKVVRGLEELRTSLAFNGVRLFSTRQVVVGIDGFPPIDLTVGPLPEIFDLGRDLTPLGAVPGTDLVARRVALAMETATRVKTLLEEAWVRMGCILNVLGVQVENTFAAGSWVEDEALACEVVNLVKFQVINDIGWRTLSQAGPTPLELIARLRKFEPASPGYTAQV